MSIDGELDECVRAILPELTELRHELHRYPQLGYEETFANERVCEALDEAGIAYESGLAATGVVGWLKPGPGGNAAEGAAVGLRADMDALAIEEQTELPYASEHPGRMHACGHDGHTAMLVGAAQVLGRLRDRLPRPVKLIFQPAEEGLAGAKRMLDEGALDRRVGGLDVRAMFGLHADPRKPVGTLLTRPQEFMAASDMVHIRIEGRGAHAAMPHEASDAVLAAAQIITALQSVVARNVKPLHAAVLSIGSIHGGEAFNILPDRVELTGTTRAFDPDTWRLLHERIRAVAGGVAEAMGCRAEVSFDHAYPALLNDEALTGYAAAVAGSVLGREQVEATGEPLLGGEDFAFYRDRCPGSFAFLGVCPPSRSEYPGLHTSRFDFTDAALAGGVKLLCRYALDARELPGEA